VFVITVAVTKNKRDDLADFETNPNHINLVVFVCIVYVYIIQYIYIDTCAISQYLPQTNVGRVSILSSQISYVLLNRFSPHSPAWRGKFLGIPRQTFQTPTFRGGPKNIGTAAVQFQFISKRTVIRGVIFSYMVVS
jgi:hypothetical protein